MRHVIADLFESSGYLLFDRDFPVERADAFVGPLALLDPTLAVEYTLPKSLVDTHTRSASWV